MAKAATYARNQWEALRRYTDDGRLTIDNNVSERTLRHQAIGRKNWLFLGSEAAGPRAAVLYTILAGAKRHHIEPWAYVRDLLLRLHADDRTWKRCCPTAGRRHIPTRSSPIAWKNLAPKRSAPEPAAPIAAPARNSATPGGSSSARPMEGSGTGGKLSSRRITPLPASGTFPHTATIAAPFLSRPQPPAQRHLRPRQDSTDSTDAYPLR